MEDRGMKAGVWIYGLGSILTGILNIAWGDFDGSHQPIQALGTDFPGQHLLAYVVGVWLVAAGVAILWQRTQRVGAMASGMAYLLFTALWLPRYFASAPPHVMRIAVVAGVTFGLAQQVMLVAPAALVYASGAGADSAQRNRAGSAARWMLGLPPIVFGLFHLAAIPIFAGIVPHWMGWGKFWAVLTGVAFLLAGLATCSRVKDVLALRLLALMLLLFEVLVEAPPILIRLHDERTWGAAVYNVTAMGGCWIYAEFLAGRAGRGRLGVAENAARDRSDPMVA